MNRERIRAHLIFEEGLNLERHKVDGKDHIGYGFNLEDEWEQDLLDYLGVKDEDDINELTQEQADYILDWWIDNITATISKRFGDKFTKLSALRQENLFSMRYQHGAGGLRAYRKMWAAIEDDDYDEASAQMLDSVWAREQSPKRAQRIATAFQYDKERYLELDKRFDEPEIDAQDVAVFGDDVLKSISTEDLLDELRRRLEPTIETKPPEIL